MIDINLIPIEKQRRRKKGGILPAGFVLPREVVIGLVGGFLVLLAVTHILLQFAIMAQYVQLTHQKAIWKNILPHKQEVDEVMTELRKRQMRLKTISEIRGDRDILWAAKLNELSNTLPSGVWIRSFAMEESGIIINGSSVSKQKLEKISIYNYVKAIKESKLFMDGIQSVEVESVRTRHVGEVSVADFVIHIVLK